MSEQQFERLADLVDSWRATADIWQEALDDDPKNHRVRVRGAQQPPDRRRGDIQNWINWLRACAQQVEDTAAREAMRKEPTR